MTKSEPVYENNRGYGDLLSLCVGRRVATLEVFFAAGGGFSQTDRSCWFEPLLRVGNASWNFPSKWFARKTQKIGWGNRDQWACSSFQPRITTHATWKMFPLHGNSPMKKTWMIHVFSCFWKWSQILLQYMFAKNLLLHPWLILEVGRFSESTTWIRLHNLLFS